MYENFVTKDDIPLSFVKILNYCDHQVNYYNQELEQMSQQSTEIFLLNKPSRDYYDLAAKRDEWIWFKEHLIDTAVPNLLFGK